MKAFTFLNIFLNILNFSKIFNAQVISKIQCAAYSLIETKLTHPYPQMVGVGFFDSELYFNICGGNLINENYVLATARCVLDLDDELVVIFSTYDIIDPTISDSTEIYKVKKIHFHNAFNESFGYNDIALLELNETVKLDYRHRPACLWTDEFIINKPPITTGWGGLFPGEEHRERFKQYRVNILQNHQCEKHYIKSRYFPNGVFDNQMCVNATDLTNNLCDSLQGNPIELIHKNNFHIIAIISYINTVCDDNEGKVATRISSFVPWIESIVWPDFVSVPNCGQRKIKHKPLITFSHPTYHGEFPWHVALNRKDNPRSKTYICGGSLLNQKTVLTAAHCVFSEDGLTIPERLTVELGKYRLDVASTDTREIEIYEVIIHEEYDRNYLENDIAILVLKNLVPYSDYIQPICLTNTSSIFDTTLGVVPGWGRDETNTPTVLLNQASLPIVPNEQCRNSNRAFFPNFLNDKNYCAGYQNGTNVCTGDSGGGMVISVTDRFYLKGIVSLGVALPNNERCDITQLVLFTDVTKYYNWIISHIQP